MMIDCLFQVLINILLFSKIQFTYSLVNKTRSHVSWYLSNDNKVRVDLDDGGPWRIIKTSANRYELRSVMCRQLGLGPPISPGYISDTNFLFYDSFIGADAFVCTGWESELSECQIDNQSTTGHMWLFYSSYVMQLNCLPAEAEEFSVALQREYSHMNVGVPVIFFEGQWGPICHNERNTDEFHNNYNVFCKQLGFDRATDFPYSYIVDVVFWPPVSLDVSCTGEEYNITECEHSPKVLSQKCDAFTRISCGSYYSTMSIDVSAGGGKSTTLHPPTFHPAFGPGFTTAVLLPPDSASSTNIGLSIFILCIIVIVGGCLLCGIFAFCWKILKTPAPVHVHYTDHLVLPTSGAAQGSSLHAPTQDRSQYITDMGPQYSQAPPELVTKDPELPTYEEAMELDAANLNNVPVTAL